MALCGAWNPRLKPKHNSNYFTPFIRFRPSNMIIKCKLSPRIWQVCTDWQSKSAVSTMLTSSVIRQNFAFCCCTKEPMRHLRVSQPIFVCRMCIIFATWDRRAEMKSHFVTSEYVSLLPIQLRVDLVHALYGELIMLIACLCVIRGRRNHGDYCSRRCTVSTVARTYPRDTHLKTLFWSTAGRG